MVSLSHTVSANGFVCHKNVWRIDKLVPVVCSSGELENQVRKVKRRINLACLASSPWRSARLRSFSPSCMRTCNRLFLGSIFISPWRPCPCHKSTCMVQIVDKYLSTDTVSNICRVFLGTLPCLTSQGLRKFSNTSKRVGISCQKMPKIRQLQHPNFQDKMTQKTTHTSRSTVPVLLVWSSVVDPSNSPWNPPNPRHPHTHHIPLNQWVPKLLRELIHLAESPSGLLSFERLKGRGEMPQPPRWRHLMIRWFSRIQLKSAHKKSLQTGGISIVSCLEIFISSFMSW